MRFKYIWFITFLSLSISTDSYAQEKHLIRIQKSSVSVSKVPSLKYVKPFDKIITVSTDPDSKIVGHLNQEDLDKAKENYYIDKTYEVYTKDKIDKLVKALKKRDYDLSKKFGGIMNRTFKENGLLSVPLDIWRSDAVLKFDEYSQKIKNTDWNKNHGWDGEKLYFNEHWLNDTANNMYLYFEKVPYSKDNRMTNEERTDLRNKYLKIAKFTTENLEFKYPFVSGFRREYLSFKALAATRQNELSISALENALIATIPADIAKVDTKADKLSKEVEKLTNENQRLKNRLNDLEDKLDMLLKQSEN